MITLTQTNTNTMYYKSSWVQKKATPLKKKKTTSLVKKSTKQCYQYTLCIGSLVYSLIRRKACIRCII